MIWNIVCLMVAQPGSGPPSIAMPTPALVIDGGSLVGSITLLGLFVLLLVFGPIISFVMVRRLVKRLRDNIAHDRTADAWARFDASLGRTGGLTAGERGAAAGRRDRREANQRASWDN